MGPSRSRDSDDVVREGAGQQSSPAGPRTSDAPTRVRSAGEPAALARECGPVRAGVGSRSSRNGRVALRPSPRPHRQIFGSPTLDVRTSGRQESLLQPSEEEASSAL